MQKFSATLSSLLALGALSWGTLAHAEPLPQLPEVEPEEAAPQPRAERAPSAAPAAAPRAPLGPKFLPYDRSKPIPEGYTLQKRPRTGLIIGGALTAGIPYVVSALFGIGMYDSGGPRNEWGLSLLVPVVGPLVALPVGGVHYFGPAWTTLLLSSAIAQGAGVSMLIVGLAAPRKSLVRSDLLRGALGDNVRLLPTAGRDSAGLMLLGTF